MEKETFNKIYSSVWNIIWIVVLIVMLFVTCEIVDKIREINIQKENFVVDYWFNYNNIKCSFDASSSFAPMYVDMCNQMVKQYLNLTNQTNG